MQGALEMEHDVEAAMDRYDRDQPTWLASAYEALEWACLHHAEVTTDLIWPRLVFPTGRGGGRVMGRAIRTAQHRRWMTKAFTSDGKLLCLDHVGLAPVATPDGTVINRQGPVVIYESLLWRG